MMSGGPELSSVLTEQLETILERFDSLYGILVCTAEGVPLVKVTAANAQTPIVLDYAETALPTVFAAAIEQIGKLNFGAVQSVTSFYDNIVLLHISDLPLVVTLIATEATQIGALLAVAPQLRKALAPLKTCADSADLHSMH